jgi:hypothetical protein
VNRKTVWRWAAKGIVEVVRVTAPRRTLMRLRPEVIEYEVDEYGAPIRVLARSR